MARMQAEPFSWGVIIGVLAVTGVIDIIDPSLYEHSTFLFDLAFNIVVSGVGAMLFTLLFSGLMRWLFLLSGFNTTYKDNVAIGAWSGGILSLVLLPFSWAVEYMNEDVFILCMLGAVVYTTALSVIAYRSLTRASWMQIVGVFIAVGFILVAAAAVIIAALDVTGLLPAEPD
jgi:hypothetical protein